LGVYDCPKFSNVCSLAIDNTSLFVRNPSQLHLFLTSKLRELRITTEPGQGRHLSQAATDRAWMSRLAAACVHLNVLALDVALGVSPADMMSLLCTTQLKPSALVRDPTHYSTEIFSRRSSPCRNSSIYLWLTLSTHRSSMSCWLKER